MEKSTSLAAIGKALVQFHSKVSKVSKDSKNPFFNSKYASLSNILEAIQSPLEESGLSFTQFPTNENGLTTILIHGESGEYIQETYTMRPTKDDPQGRGSTITYQRRYALAAILGLNIDEDDDGNAGSKQASKKAANSERGVEYWKGRVNTCFTLDQLNHLYINNNRELEGKAELLQVFSDRRKAIPSTPIQPHTKEKPSHFSN